jgi:two-component system sensor histidine kinase/response regulator
MVTTDEHGWGPRPGLASPPAVAPPEAIDWDTALDALDGDQDLLRMVVEAALQECPQQLEDLRHAIAVGDAPVVRRLTHTLKGSLRLFGLPRITQHAFELELLGQQGALADAPAAFAVLEPEVTSFLQQLRDYLHEGPPLSASPG